jgi:hypothetical protein
VSRGRTRVRFALGFAVAVFTAADAGAASDTLLAALEQRVAHSGVESTNAHLTARGSTDLTALNGMTAACERQAVALSVRLMRSRNARAANAHGEALRAAVGVCTGYVLGLITLQEVPKVCASVASWGVVQTARELRHRIAEIDTDELLRTSRNGEACRAAYWHELHTTRVVVKRAAAGASRP